MPEEKWREDEITCPICGWSDGDSWEYADQDTVEIECEDCGAPLEVGVDRSVSFTTRVTSCVAREPEQAHVWGTWGLQFTRKVTDRYGPAGRVEQRFCTQCCDYEYRTIPLNPQPGRD